MYILLTLQWYTVINFVFIINSCIIATVLGLCTHFAFYQILKCAGKLLDIGKWYF